MKVVVVLPAYHAEATLEKTVNDIPMEYVDEIILVDDNSSDKTIEVAQRLNLITFRHEKNLGYGGNQKTCYTKALERGADIIIMLHPDYQYDASIIKYFVELIRDDRYDMMLGSRIRSRAEALAGGMPLYKYFSNRALTIFQNSISGRNLSEWHTGMRAYKRNVLEAIDFLHNANGFVFDSQLLFQVVEKNFRIGEIPVPVRYLEDSSSISFKNSMIYGLRTVWVGVRFVFRKLFKAKA